MQVSHVLQILPYCVRFNKKHLKRFVQSYLSNNKIILEDGNTNSSLIFNISYSQLESEGKEGSLKKPYIFCCLHCSG